ncbi:hypothetical protein BC567DRAFT_289086, partial [Phyllosticta citribraziliensis]
LIAEPPQHHLNESQQPTQPNLLPQPLPKLILHLPLILPLPQLAHDNVVVQIIQRLLRLRLRRRLLALLARPRPRRGRLRLDVVGQLLQVLVQGGRRGRGCAGRRWQTRARRLRLLLEDARVARVGRVARTARCGREGGGGAGAARCRRVGGGLVEGEVVEGDAGDVVVVGVLLVVLVGGGAVSRDARLRLQLVPVARRPAADALPRARRVGHLDARVLAAALRHVGHGTAASTTTTCTTAAAAVPDVCVADRLVGSEQGARLARRGRWRDGLLLRLRVWPRRGHLLERRAHVVVELEIRVVVDEQLRRALVLVVLPEDLLEARAQVGALEGVEHGFDGVEELDDAAPGDGVDAVGH